MSVFCLFIYLNLKTFTSLIHYKSENFIVPTLNTPKILQIIKIQWLH